MHKLADYLGSVSIPCEHGQILSFYLAVHPFSTIKMDELLNKMKEFAHALKGILTEPRY